MKIVTKSKITHPLLTHLFISDLDRLDEIISSVALARKEEVARLGDEFSSILLHLRIGAFHKRTGSGRLAQTERAIVRHLDRGNDEINLLDVGASDGTTTCQLAHAVEAAVRQSCKAIAMDVCQSLVVFEGEGLREYRTPDGMPVMVRKGGLALALPESKDSRDFFRRWLARVYMETRPKLKPMRPLRRISLVSPLVQASRNVIAVEKSILAEEPLWRGRFDAVRASNVLNPRFFAPDDRRRVLSFIHSYLKPLGLLVISRNHLEMGKEVERGSLWRRASYGFELIEDFGGGSEIKADVDAFRFSRLRA